MAVVAEVLRHHPTRSVEWTAGRLLHERLHGRRRRRSGRRGLLMEANDGLVAGILQEARVLQRVLQPAQVEAEVVVELGRLPDGRRVAGLALRLGHSSETNAFWSGMWGKR